MAHLHPTTSLVENPYAYGARKEREVLALLEQHLPEGFDIFHGLEWSSYFQDRQHIGEIDIAVVTPSGVLALLEVKAGEVLEADGLLFKSYTGVGAKTKNINAQVRRQHTAVLGRLREARMSQVDIASFLVLPDCRLQTTSLGYVQERVIDAVAMPTLCEQIMALQPAKEVPASQRNKLMDFLADRFQIAPDMSTRIGHVQKLSRSMASGLATWVPQMQHASGHYMVQATAGAGKTQLALRLLQDGVRQGKRVAYMCFNRALADHMGRLAPEHALICTLDQFCVAEARRAAVAIDFGAKDAFDKLRQRLVNAPALPRWDLLVVDEIQDLLPEWVTALRGLVEANGVFYMLGDRQQDLYARGQHDWPDAVKIQCHDNFRSPRRVVDCLNAFGLSQEPVQARSVIQGELPGFYQYDPGDQDDAVKQVAACVRRLQGQGVALSDMVLISYSGKDRSQVLAQEQIAGVALQKATGRYNEQQQAVWTEGELLADTLYRFKGQSAPMVILCEVDFDALTDSVRKRLFVAFTRAQYRLEVVLSARAEAALMQSIR